MVNPLNTNHVAQLTTWNEEGLALLSNFEITRTLFYSGELGDFVVTQPA